MEKATVGIRELKDMASSIIDRVEHGEAITVAQTPDRQGVGQTGDAAVDLAEGAGLVVVDEGRPVGILAGDPAQLLAVRHSPRAGDGVLSGRHRRTV